MPRVLPRFLLRSAEGPQLGGGARAHTRKNAQRAKGKPRPRIMRERVHAGRGHVTRTKRAGTAAIPPPWPTAQIVLLRPEPPPFPTMPKKARGYTQRTGPPLEKRGVPLSRQSLGFRTIPPSRVCAVPRAGNAPANDAPA